MMSIQRAIDEAVKKIIRLTDEEIRRSDMIEKQVLSQIEKMSSSPLTDNEEQVIILAVSLTFMEMMEKV